MSWYIRFYNWFHKWRMRNARMRLDKLRDLEVATLNDLSKIIPVLRGQLSLIKPLDLSLVKQGDIYKISNPVHFLQYYFYREWLKNAISTMATSGNKEDTGYLDLNNTIPGYTTQVIDVRVSNWLPFEVIGNQGVDLVKFYTMVGHDLDVIEKAMTTMTDPFFKNYYSKKLAVVLQDLLIVIYSINDMVAFYEWRR